MFRSKSLMYQTRYKFRNLILLFFTIVFGFGTIMVLADLTIQTNIGNARQTIMRTTFTSDGTDSGTVLVDINSGHRIFINDTMLDAQSSFTGNILGIGANGILISVPANGLIISGGSAGGNTYWTGATDSIRNTNTGSVGIGAAPTTGKLYVTSTAETELALEDSGTGNAANIHFTNQTRTWTIGGDSAPDLFYLGVPGTGYINILGTNGYVGIGTTGPKAPLQIIGNLIVGMYGNDIIGNFSTVLGGRINTIEGDYSFIGGGTTNVITGNVGNSFIGGGHGNEMHAGGNENFIGGGYQNKMFGGGTNNFIGGGMSNTISSGSYNMVGGGFYNTILTGNYSTIIGGWANNIYNSRNSTIIGGYMNRIVDADYSTVGGTNAYASHDNSFVRNSDNIEAFFTIKPQTFIINALSGVGIRTNNPQGDLHVAGSGVVVFEPQTANPQGTSWYCTTTGSIIFNEGTNKLCYCNGTKRMFVDGAGVCSF